MPRYKINTFRRLANTYIEENTEDVDIKTINRTKLFYKELKAYIKHDEIIDIQILGLPTTGKSTVAFVIGHKIHTMLKKHKKLNKNNWQFNLRQNIVRDQREAMEKYKNKNVNHTVLCVDEFDELEEGGENVTAIKAFMNKFTNVDAQRYIHRIGCAITEIIDKNADIIIEIQQADKQKQTTMGYLYYRLFRGGIEYRKLLGHLNINVSETLQKTWYQEYRRRKFLKMDLITKHGIFRPRHLHYAPIKLKTIQELKPLTKISGRSLITKEHVLATLIKNMKEAKEEYAMLGIDFLAKEPLFVLTMYRELHTINMKILILKKRYAQGKEHTDGYDGQMLNLEKVQKTLLNSIRTFEDDLRKMIRIKDEYERIEENNSG